MGENDKNNNDAPLFVTKSELAAAVKQNSLVKPVLLVGALITGALFCLAYSVYFSLNNYPQHFNAESISLVSADNPHVLVLTPDGLSVKNKTDDSLEPMAAIFLNEENGAVIGVWSKGNRRNLDLSIRDKEQADLEYIDGDGVHHKLSDLFKPPKKIGDAP